MCADAPILPEKISWYHLKHQEVKTFLPPFLRKILPVQGKICLHGTSLHIMQELSRSLWHARGFLPHGCEGEDDITQTDLYPLWLSTTQGPTHFPTHLWINRVPDYISSHVICVVSTGLSSQHIQWIKTIHTQHPSVSLKGWKQNHDTWEEDCVLP